MPTMMDQSIETVRFGEESVRALSPDVTTLAKLLTSIWSPVSSKLHISSPTIPNIVIMPHLIKPQRRSNDLGFF
ncbi:hypothetical protein HI914_02373 [Erysiphe necator]|nr:hypothetical protein HI914_02373 [Erysiphe necator]